MPLWCQIGDASMVSQKWCLNGVTRLMPYWCQKSDAFMVSQTWCLTGVKKVMPSWCHKIDALLVSKKWRLYGATNIDAMMVSCIHDAVTVPCNSEEWRLRCPPSPYLSIARCQDGVSTPLGFTWVWPNKMLVFGPFFWAWRLPGSKLTNTRKNHSKSSRIFCLIVLVPI